MTKPPIPTENSKTKLVKLGKKDSSNCTVCDSEEETIYHLFWECRNVKDLLHRIENIFVENNVPIHFSDRTFLFGVLDRKKASKPYNNIIMSTKCYIYRCRCLNTRLSLMGLIHDLKTLYIVNKQKRSTEGCSKFKSPETRQVQERLVSTLEHMQVPKWDRTRCPEE